LQEVQFR
jgi:hypothetical protein